MEAGNQSTGGWRYTRLDLMAIAIGVILLLFRLGNAPMSNDEAAYAFRVYSTWGHMWSVLAQDNYPVGYFLFLKPWTTLFGIGEWSLRLSSFPFAVLTWLIFIRWARQIFTPKVATAAILLLIFSPYFLFLSRLAKYFALLNFFSLAAFLLLWELLRDGRPIRAQWRKTLLFGLACLGLVYTHYLGVVQTLVMGLWLLLSMRKSGKRPAGELFVVLCVVAALYIPQIYLVLQRLLYHSDEAITPLDGSFGRRFVIQTGYFAYSTLMGHTLELSRFVLAGIGGFAGGIAVLLGILRAAKTTIRGGDNEDAAARYALFSFVLTGLASFVVMWVFLGNLPDMVYGERISFLFPLLVVLVVNGLQRWPNWVRGALLVAWGVPAILSLANIYTFKGNNVWDYTIEWNEMVDVVESEEHTPRIVIVDSWAMGSRGWYYFADRADEFYETRKLEEENTVQETIASLPENGVVYYILETRTGGSDSTAEIVRTNLEQKYGNPVETYIYAKDSPSMKRLKEWVRRGSGVETYEGKVQMLEFSESKTN